MTKCIVSDAQSDFGAGFITLTSVTSGNALVVALDFFGTGSPIISDDKGNTYALLFGPYTGTRGAHDYLNFGELARSTFYCPLKQPN